MNPDATIFQCGDEVVTPVVYEETEHYPVTRDFLMNRERMLRVLLER